MEGGEQEESLESFLKWASDLGITDSPLPNDPSQSQTQTHSSSSCLGQSLCVANFPDSGGRGLAAARALKKHEVVLRVPKSALMTTESLTSKDQKLACYVRRHTHLSSTLILSVCLLAEMGKGKSSWWRPYLMQLPRRYDTLASFSRFEISALQVDEAIWAAEKAILKAESDWKEALPLMKELNFKPKLLTFRSWLWASATISSRTMHVHWDDAGCLCPVGDFFNYAAPGEESLYSEDVESPPWRDTDLQKEKVKCERLEEQSMRLTDAGYKDEVDAYYFYARKDYRKGEQVLLTYGTYSNLELLEHYGFLLDMNPNEKAFIELRSEIVSNSWPNDSMYIQLDGMPSFALVSALRLWATPQNKRKSVSHLIYSGLQLSAENEMSVMKWVKNNCRVLLEKLPSSVEDDIFLLDFIEKMQDWSVNGVEQMLLVCGGELGDFFEANGLQKAYIVGEFQLSEKVRRSVERWKLAIQWRIRYKKILVDCVCYCTEMINSLSSQIVTCNIANST